MARFFWPRVATAASLAALAGCSGFETGERPAWRTQAEEACLAQGLVQESAWIQPSREIDGPGICGLTHPFKVRGLADGSVTVTSTATLDCSMIPALDGWIKGVLQPAALARFGEPVAEIRTMGSYNCRGINGESGGHLSEHAFGNAIDIASYVLRSGRELNIMRGWNGTDDQERAFLREAHGGACGIFTTVLGPGSNAFHYNHDHLDLAMHGGSSRGPRRICKPAAEQALPAPPVSDGLPEAPPLAEEQDVARLNGAAPSVAAMTPRPRARGDALANARAEPLDLSSAAVPSVRTGPEADVTSSIGSRP